MVLRPNSGYLSSRAGHCKSVHKSQGATENRAESLSGLLNAELMAFIT